MNDIFDMKTYKFRMKFPDQGRHLRSMRGSGSAVEITIKAPSLDSAHGRLLQVIRDLPNYTDAERLKLVKGKGA